MAKNESVDFFLRFLRERFQVFREALTAFLQTVALEERNNKVAAAKKVLTALDDLKRAIAATDRPGWIGALENKFNCYTQAVSQGQGDAGLQILQSIIGASSDIERQKWDFIDAAANVAIDFTAIYDEYYRSSRVPELFDELVTQLEQIIETGEIDSVQTIKALEKLIATIKKNSRGDLFSTKGAWEFTQLLFKNVAIDVLESVPGLKHFVKGLRKTMSELDLEMSQVHDQIRQRLTESAKADLPMLEYRPLLLPAPKDDNGPDGIVTKP